MVWQLSEQQREHLLGLDLPQDPTAYIRGINQPIGEIFQTWVDNRTQEGDASVANLVDFLVRVNLGHDPAGLYDHDLGPEAKAAGQPIDWPGSYDIATAVSGVAAYEVMAMLAESTGDKVDGPSAQEYAQAVRQAGDLGLRWLGEVHVPAFLHDASVIEEEESRKLMEDLRDLARGEELEDEGDLVGQAERQVGAVVLDPAEKRRSILAGWPLSAENLRNYNQQALKDLPEDRTGSNPLPLLVMENWVQVGDTRKVLADDDHQFLLDNCTRGSVWIARKGGAFNPGTIAVSGPFSEEDKARLVRRFGEFSKKAVEFRP